MKCVAIRCHWDQTYDGCVSLQHHRRLQLRKPCYSSELGRQTGNPSIFTCFFPFSINCYLWALLKSVFEAWGALWSAQIRLHVHDAIVTITFNRKKNSFYLQQVWNLIELNRLESFFKKVSGSLSTCSNPTLSFGVISADLKWCNWHNKLHLEKLSFSCSDVFCAPFGWFLGSNCMIYTCMYMYVYIWYVYVHKHVYV